MGEAYRDENQAAFAAVGRLREENGHLRAELYALQERLLVVERRAGVTSPVRGPRSSLGLAAAIAGAVLFVVIGLVAFFVRASARRDTWALPPAPAIGIESCDLYLAKWNHCYKDPSIRASAEPAFKQVAASWRSMAENPAQRAALDGACKTMVANFPESSCQK
jgi:hypothetical protein